MGIPAHDSISLLVMWSFHLKPRMRLRHPQMKRVQAAFLSHVGQVKSSLLCKIRLAICEKTHELFAGIRH